MWYKIGVSDKAVFYWATVEVVKISKVALYLSFVLFLLGMSPPLFHLHNFFMSSALLAFYLSVMYIQIIGFINAAPSVAASRVLLILFITGLVFSFWIGYVAYLAFSILYGLLYIKGVGQSPGLAPNLLTLAGILLLPTATSPIEALATYPLASVYSLLYRIDGARSRKKYDVKTGVFLTMLYTASYILFKNGIIWAFIIPSVALTIVTPPRVNDLYGVGSFIFRWGVALAPLDHHIFYMSFAVIMSVLCVPYFIPAVIYRKVPNYGLWLFGLVTAAFVTRVFNILTASGLITLLTLIYVVYKSYREEEIKLEPPPT